jgi:ArsR family metal-binding transcriptional regulator
MPLTFIALAVALTASAFSFMMILSYTLHFYSGFREGFFDILGRIVAKAILKNNYLTMKMAKGIHKYLAKQRKDDFELQIQEVRDKQEFDKAELEKKIEISRRLHNIPQYPCSKCGELFDAPRPDDLFTVAMRERCEVCDILNLTLFRRWNFECSHCGEGNFVFFHHKDMHSESEIRLAEKLFFERDEF